MECYWARSLRQWPEPRFTDGNLEPARAADDFGYDTVWLAEHHFSPYGTIADPLGSPRRWLRQPKIVRMGPPWPFLHFHNPIMLAERAAMVDSIGDGRLDLGVGRGYQEHEFRSFNIPMDESTERFVEAVSVVEDLLQNTTYSWDGKFSKGEDICIFRGRSQRGFRYMSPSSAPPRPSTGWSSMDTAVWSATRHPQPGAGCEPQASAGVEGEGGKDRAGQRCVGTHHSVL